MSGGRAHPGTQALADWIGAHTRAFAALGEPSSQLHERRDACDFDMKTQDKLAAAN
jgi:hypothetical protein